MKRRETRLRLSRGQKLRTGRVPPPPLVLSGWGTGGEPGAYDPGAPTGDVMNVDDATGPMVLEGPPPAPLGAAVQDEDGAMGYPGGVVPPAGAVPAGQIAQPGATMSTGEGAELPHWADPPTGEVPAALAGGEGGDDLQAWRLLGSRGLHWRDDVNGWAGGPGVEDLVDEAAGPIAAEDEGADPFSFDEDFDRLERERVRREHEAMAPARSSGQQAVGGGGQEEAAGATRDTRIDVFPPALSAQLEAEQQAGQRVRSGDPGAGPGRPAAGHANAPRQSAPPRQAGAPTQSAPPGQPAQAGRRVPYDLNAELAGGPGGRNVGAAVATGTGLVAVFVVCYLIGPLALLALSALGIVGCALEAYGVLQEVGFRPATLVGVLGSAGAVLGAYWKGTEALPVVMAVVLAGSLVWYLARVVEARPVVNAAVSFLVFAWVGVLGSFAGLLLEAHKGSHLFFGAVVPTVLADAAAWFAGSSLGSHPLAPHVSPSKTWEGVVAGAVVAVIAGAVIGHELSPWGGLRHGVELGVLVAVVAPVGDLVQSMVKRDLKLKDSGTVLPGHGGLLDRFDSLLFVLPAVYFLAVALHLAH